MTFEVACKSRLGKGQCAFIAEFSYAGWLKFNLREYAAWGTPNRKPARDRGGQEYKAVH